MQIHPISAAASCPGLALVFGMTVHLIGKNGEEADLERRALLKAAGASMLAGVAAPAMFPQRRRRKMRAKRGGEKQRAARRAVAGCAAFRTHGAEHGPRLRVLHGSAWWHRDHA